MSSPFSEAFPVTFAHRDVILVHAARQQVPLVVREDTFYLPSAVPWAQCQSTIAACLVILILLSITETSMSDPV